MDGGLSIGGYVLKSRSSQKPPGIFFLAFRHPAGDFAELRTRSETYAFSDVCLMEGLKIKRTTEMHRKTQEEHCPRDYGDHSEDEWMYHEKEVN